jgi:hypothetical protein
MNRFVTMAFAAALVSACGTAPTETTQAAAEPDVRQGKEVRSICFLSQVRNWRTLDRDSLIVEKAVNQEFRVVLNGVCNPNSAFLNIGLISRGGGGSCLTRGDKVVTDERPSFGPCYVREMYEWNEKALKKDEEATPPSGSS